MILFGSIYQMRHRPVKCGYGVHDYCIHTEEAVEVVDNTLLSIPTHVCMRCMEKAGYQETSSQMQEVRDLAKEHIRIV